MYSKNDYRYYLENQLAHSDDFLAHYGVKGMKWKQHKFGKKELDEVINRDQEAFYARNSVDSDRALRQMRVAQKKYDNTTLGRLDKKTDGKITAGYRILRNKSRQNAERKSREERKAREAKSYDSVKTDQERGKKRTAQVKAQKSMKADQDKGRARTAQLSKKSSEYLTELEYNSKKNDFPKSTVNTTPKKKKKKLKDRLKPKNQKVEVIYRKDNKTGEVYKKY